MPVPGRRPGKRKGMESAKTKVLIIEDSPTIAMVQAQLLETNGYDPRHAETGAAGLQLLKEWQPDILLLDITLPDTDGITILREINTWPSQDRPEILVLSGHDTPEVTFDSLRHGAQDFIRKPFRHEEFLLRVSAIVQMRQYRKSNEILQERLEGDLRKLSRYFSKDLIRAILDGSVATDPGGETMTATFLMFDLRNSTGMAEKMGPKLFFQFLSEFVADISDLIYSCNGAINKFTGDGFLVTFGLRNYSPQSTLDALACAVKIRAHVAMYNDLRPHDSVGPVGFGIGVTTGEVFAGNIGNIHKLDYTILGDPVNLSARLERMTKQAAVDILIDGKTRQIGGDRLKVKRLQTQTVRGKEQEVNIFYLEDFRLSL